MFSYIYQIRKYSINEYSWSELRSSNMFQIVLITKMVGSDKLATFWTLLKILSVLICQLSHITNTRNISEGKLIKIPRISLSHKTQIHIVYLCNKIKQALLPKYYFHLPISFYTTAFSVKIPLLLVIYCYRKKHLRVGFKIKWSNLVNKLAKSTFVYSSRRTI